MHDAERLVAFSDCLHHDAEPENVGKLLEANGLPLHLAPDRIGALAPSRHVGFDAAFGELSRELLLDLGYQADIFCFECIETLADNRIGF